MSALRGARRHGVLGLAVAAAMAVATGCGGSDGGGSTPATTTAAEAPDQATMLADDAQAKSAVRALQIGMETCFVDAGSYAGCGTQGAADAMGLEVTVGRGPGEVEVSESSPGGYVLVGRSASGNEFFVEKGAGGAVKRTCSQAATAGCKAGGTW